MIDIAKTLSYAVNVSSVLYWDFVMEQPEMNMWPHELFVRLTLRITAKSYYQFESKEKQRYTFIILEDKVLHQ